MYELVFVFCLFTYNVFEKFPHMSCLPKASLAIVKPGCVPQAPPTWPVDAWRVWWTRCYDYDENMRHWGKEQCGNRSLGLVFWVKSLGQAFGVLSLWNLVFEL